MECVYEVPAGSVVSDVIYGEAIVLNLAAGSYDSSDGVGALVWQAVLDGAARSQLLDWALRSFHRDMQDPLPIDPIHEVEADIGWPTRKIEAQVEGFVVVNLVSRSPSGRWSLAEAHDLIGHAPADASGPPQRPVTRDDRGVAITEAEPSDEGSGGQRTPIFLLPGLAASVADMTSEGSALYDVYSSLCRHGEVTPLLHLPDIDHHSRDCVDLGTTVSSMTAEIMRRCRGTSPVLMGYAIGGFIAFEICRRLEQQGLQARLLIMLDSSAVYDPAPKPPLIARIALSARSGPTAALATSPFLALMAWGRLEGARVWLVGLRRLVDRSRGGGMRIELLIAYWLVAIRNFKLARYDGRVVLLKARKGRPRIPDPALGWAPFAPQIEVIAVDGDHWSMLSNGDLLQKISDTMTSVKSLVSPPVRF